MPSPLLETACTVAVLLGLYGFLCYWEASRAELASVGRHGAVEGMGAAGYRLRGRLSLAGSVLIALGLTASALV
jgi:hypothetical protein